MTSSRGQNQRELAVFPFSGLKLCNEYNLRRKANGEVVKFSIYF